MEKTLLDTGPLLTFLGEGLDHEAWTRKQWAKISPPMLTCEPVLTEAVFLLKREGIDADPLFKLLDRGIFKIGLHVEDEHLSLRNLMHRYRDRPMSLADACLVRMSELYGRAKVFTFDSDFQIYRKNGRQMIPVLMPPQSRT